MRHLQAQMQLDHLLLERHVRTLQLFVKKSNFVERCLDDFMDDKHDDKAATKVLDMLDDSDEEANPAIQKTGVSREALRATCIALYKQFLEKEANKKMKADKAEAQKAQKQNLFLLEMAKKTPAEYIAESTEAIVVNVLSSKGKGRGKAQVLAAVSTRQRLHSSFP